MMVKLAVLNDVDDTFLLVSCHVPVFFKTRVTKSLSYCRDPSHLTLTLCSPFEFLSFILTFLNRLRYIRATARNSAASLSSLLLEVFDLLVFLKGFRHTCHISCLHFAVFLLYSTSPYICHRSAFDPFLLLSLLHCFTVHTLQIPANSGLPIWLLRQSKMIQVQWINQLYFYAIFVLFGI